MLFSILGALTGLGGAISQITSSITNLKIAQVNAGTDVERSQLAAQEQEAHDRRAVLIAEAGSRLNAIIRGMIAFGPMSYLVKVFVWDKVVGSLTGHSCHPDCSSFNTDALDTNLWKVVVAVIAFYFVYDMTARFRK